VPIPELNEERRVEMTRVAGKYAEQARVAVRNVRRDGMEKLKKMEKEGDLSQDDQHLYGDEIQSMTDRIIGLLDEALATKETEIMQV
jgi:ribosome recycling factor